MANYKESRLTTSLLIKVGKDELYAQNASSVEKVESYVLPSNFGVVKSVYDDSNIDNVTPIDLMYVQVGELPEDGVVYYVPEVIDGVEVLKGYLWDSGWKILNIKGESGVYIGEEEPTDEDVNVWVNPDAEGLIIPIKTSELVNDSGFVTEEDLANSSLVHIGIQEPSDNSIWMWLDTRENNLIKFTVSSELEAEPGMTWRQWVDSEYNTINASIDGEYVQYVQLATGRYICTQRTPSDVFCHPDDAIIEDFVYDDSYKFPV